MGLSALEFRAVGALAVFTFKACRFYWFRVEEL